MEGVLRDIKNILVYIDDLLAHTDTHEKHLEVLGKVLAWLHRNHLKINLEKCMFGNKEVSYLGFTLLPEGIKPGKNKLKAIKDAKMPTDIKTIWSFVSLCNFFWIHIKDFALIAAPLFWLTCKDLGYKSGPLPEAAFQAFYAFQKPLTSETVMAFPKADRHYELITDEATCTANTPGGLGAILIKLTMMESFTPSCLHHENWRTMRKITCHFFSKQPPSSGAWTSSMNGEAVHPIHEPQTIGKVRSLTQ
jgi:hypothetical protein